jgi:hypothetical protein
MVLSRKDIETISKVLEQFPDLDTFEIKQDSSSGIGSYTSITFAREISGLNGNFTVEISGVEDW